MVSWPACAPGETETVSGLDETRREGSPVKKDDGHQQGNDSCPGEGPGWGGSEQLGSRERGHDCTPVRAMNASSRERVRGARPSTASCSWPAISPTSSGVAPRTFTKAPSPR